MTQEQASQLYIVKVRYYSETTDSLSDRQYTYFSEDPLIVGDVVTVPVRDTTAKAQVSTIQVPEYEIERFRDKVEVIPAGSIVQLRAEPEVIERAFLPMNQEVPLTFEVEAAEAEAATPTLRGVMGTAIINIRPQHDQVVQVLHDQAVHMVDDANALIIESSEDMIQAATDLNIIASIKKYIEEKRKEYTQPINEHLAAINTAFKTFTEPIQVADRIVRNKMLVYNAEEARQRQEQEEINRLRMEAAQKEIELTGELSESVDLVEVQPEAPKTVQTDMGSAGQRDVWKYEVTDFAALPDEYKVVDTAMLNSIAKKHHGWKQIPGVRFYSEPGIVVKR